MRFLGEFVLGKLRVYRSYTAGETTLDIATQVIGYNFKAIGLYTINSNFCNIRGVGLGSFILS